VYLLLGDEDFRADQALASLLDTLLPPEERALNLDVVYAGEAPVQDIVTRCETLPFFGARRVVVVRRGEGLRAPEQDALADYLEPGPPPCALVLIAASLDRRRRLYAVIQRVGRVIPCGRLDPDDLPGWVRARARAEGKTIAPGAAYALIGRVGGGLRELGLEIAKLAAFAGDRATITEDDVRTVASHLAEGTVFELMDAVGRRDAASALRLLHAVLAIGEPPGRILYLLEDQLRMLLRTRALVERRAPAADVRAVLGARAWLYGRYRQQVAMFEAMDVRYIFALLVETDEAIKTGVSAPRLAIEALIARLCAA
jgi:DNA polymerase-3 subunit delta